MQFTKIDDLDPLISDLFTSGEASQITNSAARKLEECQEILHGFVLAAKVMGMSDVLGVLRSRVSGDESESALKVLKALDLLEAEGVSTAEPDLETLLDTTGL